MRIFRVPPLRNIHQSNISSVLPFCFGIVAGLALSCLLSQICSVKLLVSNNHAEKSRNLPEILNDQGQPVRLFCWILTGPKNHLKKAVHVNRTWGQRCDKLLFMSSVTDSHLNTIALPNVTESREGLWGKTIEAFKYIWANHRNDADWFLKADDDTYVVVENLKKFLSTYSSNDSLLVGSRRVLGKSKEWVDGGAGYVLSRNSLRVFVEEALSKPNICNKGQEGGEDFRISRCLTKSGVRIVRTTDLHGRYRFMNQMPTTHLFPRNYFYSEHNHPSFQGMNCCASDAISFHHNSPKSLYLMEYLLYHLRPHGIHQEQNYTQWYPLEFPPPKELQSIPGRQAQEDTPV